MNTATVENVAFENAAAQAQAAKAQAGSFFKRLFNAIAARQERVAMARLAAIDPRLVKEIQAARDRADW